MEDARMEAIALVMPDLCYKSADELYVLIKVLPTFRKRALYRERSK